MALEVMQASGARAMNYGTYMHYVIEDAIIKQITLTQAAYERSEEFMALEKMLDEACQEMVYAEINEA